MSYQSVSNDLSNDCESSTQLDTGTSSTSKRKRTRGRTRNLRLIGLSHKVKIDFNQYDQPIGENASKFTSELGVIVRAPTGDAPLSCKTWDDIPEEKREKMYQRIVEKFEFEESPSKRQRIMQMFKKKYKDHRHNLKVKYYDKVEAYEEKLLNIPDGIEKDEWMAFCEYVSSAEYQEKSVRNRGNRSKQTLVHTSGTRSYVVIRAAEAQKDPNHNEPSSLKMFRITHRKKDGSMSDPAQAIVDKAASESSDMGKEERFRLALGPERHGRVRGYGLGPTPTLVFGSTATRSQMQGMLEVANKKCEMLQSRMEDVIKESEELRRRSEEESRRNEEERKKNEEERSKIEKKFDDLRSFIEEKLSRGEK